MAIWVNTRGKSTLGIGLCDRCHFKFSLDDLVPDGNAPGLRVCKKCRDEFDPYRLPARQPDDLVLPFYRPQEPLTVPSEFPTAPVLVAVLNNNFCAELSWTPSVLLGAVILEYSIYRKIGTGSFEHIVNTTLLEYEDCALSVDEIYTYYVFGVTDEGIPSLRSNESSVDTSSSITHEYTTPGVFILPYDSRAIEYQVALVAGGGGGECGSRSFNGEGSHSGGQGGGAGGYSTATLVPAQVTGPVTITVGQGGLGGQSIASDLTAPGVNPGYNRLPGNDGTASSFGSLVSATPGAGGEFQTSDAPAGVGNTGTSGAGKNGGNGSALISINGVTGQSGVNAPGGGGGGGGCYVFDGAGAGTGGNGGGIGATPGPIGGPGGTPNGTNGGSGAVVDVIGTGGAGGGGSGVGGAWGIQGGDGGDGVRGSGGGGGGNAKLFGSGVVCKAGNGGNGGNGYVRVVVRYI